jgi:hypothetical protein
MSLRWRKQKSQRWFDAGRPRCFAMIGAFHFEVTKIHLGLPAFVD